MGSQTAKYYKPGGSKREAGKKKFRSQECELTENTGQKL